ncbi:type II toxin-antitoxin system Phd/YefM family antitoxin [Mesorhizobium sp. M0761]|jgi:prevent-host-death family protein|uniref:type II toxin-antitoxin system Phd/YefM family antitoxin n=1 Tax=unclassified Mesorhizobium TaxID=325217 RepID=UPI0003CF8EFC|nr:MULTISPECIES: type II toxin-antitoxin system Phd/YefM family antitoxin [unclassified Mesorhizobium]ESX22360.1 prevent-host-death protein [Mesorhizobium sp. LSJC264A00]WJI47054.1 type II toxin-antitoxin system Phd/YefM family antitoxin [Mesorhizobium sp. C120A]WJI59549.1 type II toxin-antitoxin system Phd/YefM family antitoxin [Mesorhizobium sp. C432A]WJI72562.1 type II toxin-antitoxin system Phd/YefM family antitoxin [Mesorhizobium sp. C395A]
MNISTKTITIMSSREFNQDTAHAKRAAKNGPVIITDRGKPSHVLMSMEEYQRLEKKPRSLADAIADDRPEADFDWEPPRLEGPFFKIPELD